MGKTAFVFPGQGSQQAGMGKETHDAFSCAREAFIEADAALGFPLSRLCFEGPEEQLRLTEHTQPAILVTSIAIYRVLETRGLRPEYVAGHSLGEYSALVSAGALSLSQAVQVVRNRGKYMQEAVPVGKGTMAAVLGLDGGGVLKACQEARGSGIVSPANYNAPDQTVIAGETAAVADASERARGFGAKRVLPLAVSAPFHCDLMAPARDRLAGDLQDVDFGNPVFPVICNVDASEVRDRAVVRDCLIRQVCNPVRWVESIQLLADRGVDTFVEIGPGKVLAGLIRKIVPEARIFGVDGIRGIEALASA
jgi:[acyl-carrier-protein] S-malonyltransferase